MRRVWLQPRSSARGHFVASSRTFERRAARTQDDELGPSSSSEEASCSPLARLRGRSPPRRLGPLPLLQRTSPLSRSSYNHTAARCCHELLESPYNTRGAMTLPTLGHVPSSEHFVAYAQTFSVLARTASASPHDVAKGLVHAKMNRLLTPLRFTIFLPENRCLRSRRARCRIGATATRVPRPSPDVDTDEISPG